MSRFASTAFYQLVVLVLHAADTEQSIALFNWKKVDSGGIVCPACNENALLPKIMPSLCWCHVKMFSRQTRNKSLTGHVHCCQHHLPMMALQ